MNKDRWKIRKRIEVDYISELEELMDSLFIGNQYQRHVRSASTSMSDPLSEFLTAEQRLLFEQYANEYATKMVTGIYAAQARTWRQAASEGMQSQMIRRSLLRELSGPVGREVSALIQRNAGLIKSLPSKIVSDVNAFIAARSMEGMRAQEIAETIPAEARHLSRTRIMLIARTETSKASTALNKARSEDIGISWYVWRTSKDARVRNAHQHMDRVLVSWNEAPNPERLAGEKRSSGNYHAGEIFNCRCYPEPLLDLGQIRWPAQVYYGGVIRMMTRVQFESITMRMAA